MIAKIKHYLWTGLLVALPVFITLYFLYIIVRFIDWAFGSAINKCLLKYLGFAVPGLGVVLGFFVILGIGFLAANYFGKKLGKAIERWFLRFPFIRQVYPAAKQIVDSFISKESPAFKKVVLVEYPSKGIWSIGFLTNDSFAQADEAVSQDLVHVFIATTPSPLTGFLVLMPRRDVKILDIPIEDGIKLIVSGGIVKPIS
jgi:uncharacterized membrane protein